MTENRKALIGLVIFLLLYIVVGSMEYDTLTN